MYKTIMIPVDLAHQERLDKALATGADLAKLYGSSLHVVGVTGTAPGSVAHTPEEYAGKLTAFAEAQSQSRGVAFRPLIEIAHDPAIDLDEALEKACKEIGADLVVMASHVPGFGDHFRSSNAGYLSAHSSISVFVVR